MPLAVGTLIAGRYQVRGSLGSGAQGEVYEVTDTHEGDRVALKLLAALPSGTWNEARTLRRLADPHILPIRNADMASGQPYLVTELARGRSVDKRMAAAPAGSLDVDDVVRWIRHACHGVARAHDLGLLHNDIKPGNLFLNERDECQVGDFGFATLMDPRTGMGRPAGATVETVAPEVAQFWGMPVATASVASDVFSLGASARWMVAGQPALDFSGASTPRDRMAVAANATPPRLRDVAPHVPRAVATVIEAAMSPNPANRYASVTDLAAALGSRPPLGRQWNRTDEHAGHVGCWRGEPIRHRGGGTTLILCVSPTTHRRRVDIMTVHLQSGRRLRTGCRTVGLAKWPRAVRAIVDRHS